MIERLARTCSWTGKLASTWERITVGASLVGALSLLIPMWSVWSRHSSSEETSDAVSLAMTLLGCSQLIVALSGLWFWRSLKKQWKILTLLSTGMGVLMVSQISSIGHRPGSPDFGFWLQFRAGGNIGGFAGLLAALAYAIFGRGTSLGGDSPGD